MSKKYKTPVYINAEVSKCIGEVEGDTLEEINEAAEELWRSQGYEAPTTNIHNDFEIAGDWDVTEYCDADLRYMVNNN